MTDSTTQTFQFQADITELRNIIINHFYSKKEIALRELVSNASDALNKMRILALQDLDLLNDNNTYKDDNGNELNFIRFIPDTDTNTLTIWDSGVGMTKDELVDNLGTLAKSGTKNFINTMGKETSDLIGKFGVGFYSAFLIANKVDVYSKSYKSSSSFKWTSSDDASGSFTLTEVFDSDLKRGTKIVLHLKDDQKEFLTEAKIKQVVNDNSSFLGFPMYILETKERDVPIEETTSTVNNVVKENDVTVEDVNEDDVTVEDVNEDTVKETVPTTQKEKYTEYVHINENNIPVWLKNSSEVTEDEYKKLYKSLTNDYDDFCTYTHFKAEGSNEFNVVLFVPNNAPFDMFQKNRDDVDVKLYVRKVFITNKCKELVPDWLTFIKGVVDSSDLPLNVSREMLQENSIVKVMNKQIVKKTIEMLSTLAENEDKYKKFYDQFNKNLKLGVYQDQKNRDKLIKLLRFTSLNHPDGNLSLETYVKEMKDGQKDIYYLAGLDKETLEQSPFLEGMKKKGYDVLLMFDAIDEHVVEQVRKYNEKDLKNLSKEGVKLDEEDKDTEKEYTRLFNYVKFVLGNKIEKTSLATTLDTSPCAITAGGYSYSANMQRIMQAQALGNNTMAQYMKSKKVLELNVNHKLIKFLNTEVNKYDSDTNVPSQFKDLVTMLYDTASLTSGFNLDTPLDFAKRIHNLLLLGFDVDVDTVVQNEKDDLPPLTEDVEKNSNDDSSESNLEQVD